jgi:NADH:ubiquinone oxidoreductase subunit F (NADH-binding)
VVRLLAGCLPDRPLRLSDHLAVHGAMPRPGCDALLDAVDAAGLTGRGGAGFPLAGKLRTVAASRGRPVVVVNAAESEPASQKDHDLLTRAPHLVLDGAEIAARALRARHVVLWLHRGATGPQEVIGAALTERRTGGPRFRVVVGPDRYVAGEASAVVHRLSGGPALPTMSPHRTAERGVHGRPTLLANAETYAQLALVARHGPAWFRTAGTEREPGTMLASVRGAVREPGVVEVGVGTPFGQVLAAAGGPAEPLSAFLVGGYAGTWVRADAAPPLAMSRESLRPLGADPGVGLLLALPVSRCPLAETARLLGWLAAESTGQCGPCRHGLPAIAGRFADLVSGDAAPDSVAQLTRWAALVTGRGACHHPDGSARLAVSALQTFAPHVAEHAERGRCSDLASAPLAPLPDRARVAEAAWR